ncbi:MAG TPA: type IV toxin-antitoxin system AbiEi family antitoxin domain-containing protein [Solirubrobacterales bacterium]|nr:type IV toxin-antitoxin system AbiEi family antitoxin domain-containing protein [Solirubrobacterales bacterium]
MQHGVIALSQLAELGLSPRAVTDRVAACRLHRIHRAVFAVGHRSLTREGRWMAALLTAGIGAALSHQAAGAHHGLLRWSGRPIVTVPSWRASTEAIEFHRTRLPNDEGASPTGFRYPTSSPATAVGGERAHCSLCSPT